MGATVDRFKNHQISGKNAQLDFIEVVTAHVII